MFIKIHKYKNSLVEQMVLEQMVVEQAETTAPVPTCGRP